MMDDMIWTLMVNAAVFSLLAGVMLLVRKLLARKISAVLQYALWAVVLIKLVIPFGFESALSPLNWIAPARAAAVQPSTPNEQTSPPVELETAKKVYDPQTNIPLIPNTAAQYTSPVSIPVTTTHPPLSWEAWALMAWGAGALATGGWLLLCGRHLRRRIRRGGADVPGNITSVFNACRQRLGIRRDIALCMHPMVQAPAITGIFRPVLMLPKHIENAEKEELEHIFLHELTHSKNGDLWVITLLNLLNAVYWFNPLVWVCFKLMCKDMETICDQKVLGLLERERQNGYVRTVLKYAGHSDGGDRLQAAMSLNDGRIRMERRIHDMFKKKKTGKGTRILVALVAVLMLASCAFTACQPTPDKPAVAGKNNDNLSSIISDTSTPADTTRNDDLYRKLGAPEQWIYETKSADGKLKIVADADVTVPGVSNLPAATAKLRDFSQEEINKTVSTLLGDNLTFKETVRFTKEELEQLIIEAKKSIADQAAGVTPGPGVHVIYDQKDLDRYQGLLPNAPYEKDLKTKDLTMETLNEGDRSYLGVSVNTKVDGQAYSIRAGSLLSPESVWYINITSGASPANSCAFFGGTYLDKPYGVSLTKEQAGKQAKKIAARLTDELSLCYVAPTAASKEDTARNWGWACVFMREINGCPTAYATEDVGQSMESNVQKPVRYEKMIIIMDDMGMTGFSWENPMTITKVDNDNVSLMPFPQISQRAVEQLIQKFSKYGFVTKGKGGTITVTRVELGLMRVAKKNSPEYYFIPVWNFFNESKATEEKVKPGVKEATPPPEVDEQGNPASFLDGYPDAWGSVTINALDGSVIDRDLGY